MGSRTRRLHNAGVVSALPRSGVKYEDDAFLHTPGRGPGYSRLRLAFGICAGVSPTDLPFLSDEFGSIAGPLAAAIVVFFLAPLQRLAEGVASKAMPNTRNTPDYVAFRKLQVYEAAVAEARQGGGITEKERSLLNRLQESLGVSGEDAEAIERELD